MSLYEKGLAKVKEVWGSDSGTWRVRGGLHWLEHERVQERINYKVAGEPGLDRYQYFLKHYFAGRPPVDRVLTLGCGTGEFERGLATYGFCKEHEAVDIADAAIATAVDLARAAGHRHITYRVADLNRLTLEKERYDVIFGVSSVHHVSALERLFEQVSLGLKPGGYFVMDEFIGPSQFQWTDAQLRAINEQIQLLPDRLKRSISKPGQVKQPVARPTIADMTAADPSEAIRSAEILPLLPKYFDLLEVKGQGGALLHLLLEDITGNFNEDNQGSLPYLKQLFDLEDRLTADNVLQNDFATIIARKKS